MNGSALRGARGPGSPTISKHAYPLTISDPFSYTLRASVGDSIKGVKDTIHQKADSKSVVYRLFMTELFAGGVTISYQEYKWKLYHLLCMTSFGAVLCFLLHIQSF